MTVRLRSLARERGIPGYSRFTKAQLIVFLSGLKLDCSPRGTASSGARRRHPFPEEVA